MQVPDTDNADLQYAFKTGYRMAISGKSVNSMPSNIRRDMAMRDYFQQGWEQAVEDVSLANEQANKPEWGKRFIWFIFMILAGIGTAKLMIYNIESEKAQQQAILNGTETALATAQTPAEPTTSTPTQPTSQKVETTHQTLPSLGLLTPQQRHDLEQTQQTLPKLESIPLAPITPSNISIDIAQLCESIENREPVNPFNRVVPKYIRKLAFYTEIAGANGQTIYHRWRTDNQILATVELNIESDKFRTWSTKKLSSAWQGQWYLEVLDSNQQVIYRKPFYYGIQSNEP
ncbi:MAG: DUF2914 domain-containing protein [Thiomicrorhabdus sp.]|nr:DUF2914 domain-containing protein [Thiomicrorhabdus sp.]